MKEYWSSQQHDFVELLVKVKNRYDPDDLFQFAQSIPLTMDPDLMLEPMEKQKAGTTVN
jgi:hypothetical protein